jgi:hypothetical protein
VHRRQCSIIGSFLLIMLTVVLVNWLIGEMGDHVIDSFIIVIIELLTQH